MWTFLSHVLAATIGGLIVVLSGPSIQKIVAAGSDVFDQHAKTPEVHADFIAGAALYALIENRLSDEDFIWSEADIVWGKFIINHVTERWHQAATRGEMGAAAASLSRLYKCGVGELLAPNEDRSTEYRYIALQFDAEPLDFGDPEHMDCD